MRCKVERQRRASQPAAIVRDVAAHRYADIEIADLLAGPVRYLIG
jgi:hypothetical protein